MVHGFNKLIPNLFKYLLFHGDYEDDAMNPTFDNRGFSSRTMLILVGSEITLLCLILITIALLKIIAKTCKYIEIYIYIIYIYFI